MAFDRCSIKDYLLTYLLTPRPCSHSWRHCTGARGN